MQTVRWQPFSVCDATVADSSHCLLLRSYSIVTHGSNSTHARLHAALLAAMIVASSVASELYRQHPRPIVSDHLLTNVVVGVVVSASAGVVARAKRPAAMVTCTSAEGIIGGGCLIVSVCVRFCTRMVRGGGIFVGSG